MPKPFQHGDFTIRRYDQVRDIKSVQRIYRECNWHHGADADVIVDFHSIGSTIVAALDNSIEGFAHTVDGTMRHLDEDLRLCAVTTVLTSPLARRRGLGTATTANALSAAAKNGAAVAALGIFEQGYYDKLGFGNGGYENYVGFSPADLSPDRVGKSRVPRRISKNDWAAIDEAMKNRWIGHGGCVLEPAEVVKCEARWRAGTGEGLGFGYENDHGQLTHFFYASSDGPHGPLHICAMAYQNGEQLLELFALLRSLGDQISLVTLIEPPHLHLQDLLQHPIELQRITKQSKHANYNVARSFWQVRILNLAQCIKQTHVHGPDVEFNLVLTDPIEDYFADSNSTNQWQGIAGEYVIHLGEDSTIESRSKPKLPTLHASVNAFSRMWLGVRPASELAISDQLRANGELLDELDIVLRLPSPKWGWNF